MKILAFSDLHMARERARALVEASADADLVIGAGDFCNMRQGLDEAMALLGGITAPMVLVPGNAESAEELRAAARPGTIVLHGDEARVAGVTVFGLGGGVPPTPFGDWSWDLTEDAAAALLARCQRADIIVTHSPPKGVADITSTGAFVGSLAIRDAIQRVQPRYALCGHIHDSWGKGGLIGRTHVHNLGPSPNWFKWEAEA